MDGRIKSGQIIRASDENILYATVPQAVEHGRPELGALIFTYPHAQYILPAIQIDAYGNIDCFLHDLSLAADMVVDGIQKHHRIDALILLRCFIHPHLTLAYNGLHRILHAFWRILMPFEQPPD